MDSDAFASPAYLLVYNLSLTGSLRAHAAAAGAAAGAGAMGPGAALFPLPFPFIGLPLPLPLLKLGGEPAASGDAGASHVSQRFTSETHRVFPHGEHTGSQQQCVTSVLDTEQQSYNMVTYPAEHAQ